MSDFWKNISRYPRFFISSVIGLILIILAPLKSLFQVQKLRIVLLIFLVTLPILLYLVLRTMTGM